jgi:hypothetical protein
MATDFAAASETVGPILFWAYPYTQILSGLFALETFNFLTGNPAKIKGSPKNSKSGRRYLRE